MSSERHLLVKFKEEPEQNSGESLGKKKVSLIVLNDFGKSLAEDLKASSQLGLILLQNMSTALKTTIWPHCF